MKLLIAIPSLDFVHVDFMRCLVNLTNRLKDEGIDFDVDIRSGTLVYVARNRLATKAAQEGYTHVLWLDADMIFTDDVLDDLMWCEKDFVCGVFHARRPPHMSCIFTSLDPPERVQEYPTEPFEIAGCGFACVLMKTDVLHYVNFLTCFTPIPELGEDLAFCKRIGEAGVKMYCEPSCRVGHIGHITIWPEDEQEYQSKLK